MLWTLLALVAAAEESVPPETPEAPVDTGPSDQTVVYYNARMALREGRPLEATKLWLLRNAIEDHTERVSPHDADFESVTWAALGALGVCQDGFAPDTEGAGLWPLALHNWVVRNRGRRTRRQKPQPFEAFEVGRQQRFVSIHDVLGNEELRSVSLFRGVCYRPRVELITIGEKVNAKLSDRQVAARLMKSLLERSRDTLSDDVKGTAVIEARLFDIHLQLIALAAREARQKEREAARRGRQIGLSRESVVAMREDAPEFTFDDDSEPAEILRASVQWPVSEWMALSPERRLFLFDNARRYGGDPAEIDRIALGVIDALIAEEKGEEVQKWIAHRSEDLGVQDVIWGGERGKRLLALDREAGFTERGVISLHRGVNALETGDLPAALRSLAFALQLAPESKAANDVQSLSLRWLSYVASQFEITDALLITLQELVPRREYSQLLEDLMWGAAFRADLASFERGARNQRGRGALARRLNLLQPLARGDVGAFIARVDEGLAESPSETLRFLDQLVQRLELEDADVRASHLPTLAELRECLDELADPASRSRSGRRADALLQRTLAIVEGLGGLDEAGDTRDWARVLSPTQEVFAGSVRLAPSDPLPWPFRPGDVPAPSVFTPIDLVPEEWPRTDAPAAGPDAPEPDEMERWIFGWSIEG